MCRVGRTSLREVSTYLALCSRVAGRPSQRDGSWDGPVVPQDRTQQPVEALRLVLAVEQSFGIQRMGVTPVVPARKRCIECRVHTFCIPRRVDAQAQPGSRIRQSTLPVPDAGRSRTTWREPQMGVDSQTPPGLPPSVGAGGPPRENRAGVARTPLRFRELQPPPGAVACRTSRSSP